MNNISLKVISGLFCLLAIGSAYCMAPTFDIHIDNQVVGNIYGQPLDITYDQFGGLVTHQIPVNKIVTIPSIDILKDNSSLTFRGTADVWGSLIREAHLTKAFLIQKWKELGQHGPLLITITTPGWKMPYELVFTYSNEVPKNFVDIKRIEQKNIDNPFMNFPEITYNRLENVISVEEFLTIQPSNWKKVIAPARYVYGQTTAADFSRALLGLPEKYDWVSIISAKDLLLSRWKEGQENFKTTQFIKLMRRIVFHAKDILERRLQDTAPESGWVSLEVPNELSSSQEDSSVSSNSTNQRSSEELV